MYPEQGHITLSPFTTRPPLIVEFLVAFLALPLGYLFSPVRIPALPLLWVVSGYALWQLIRDPHFSLGRLWNAARLPGSLFAILITFAVITLMLWLGVHRIAPQL